MTQMRGRRRGLRLVLDDVSCEIKLSLMMNEKGPQFPETLSTSL
jgi:hypothetical protein